MISKKWKLFLALGSFASITTAAALVTYYSIKEPLKQTPKTNKDNLAKPKLAQRTVHLTFDDALIKAKALSFASLSPFLAWLKTQNEQKFVSSDIADVITSLEFSQLSENSLTIKAALKNNFQAAISEKIVSNLVFASTNSDLAKTAKEIKNPQNFNSHSQSATLPEPNEASSKSTSSQTSSASSTSDPSFNLEPVNAPAQVSLSFPDYRLLGTTITAAIAKQILAFKKSQNETIIKAQELEGFRAISENAFNITNNISQIFLPDSIETIGNNAFSAFNQNLEKLELNYSEAFNNHKSQWGISDLSKIVFRNQPAKEIAATQIVPLVNDQSAEQKTNTFEINQTFINNLATKVANIATLVDRLKESSYLDLLSSGQNNVKFLFFSQLSNTNTLLVEAQLKNSDHLVSQKVTITSPYAQASITFKDANVDKILNSAASIEEAILVINAGFVDSYVDSNRRDWIRRLWASKTSDNQITLYAETNTEVVAHKTYQYTQANANKIKQFYNLRWDILAIRKRIWRQKIENMDALISALNKVSLESVANSRDFRPRDFFNHTKNFSLEKINERTLKIKWIFNDQYASFDPRQEIIIRDIKFTKMLGFDENGFRQFDLTQYDNLSFKENVLATLNKNEIPYNINETTLKSAINLPQSNDDLYFFVDIIKNNDEGTITLKVYRRDYSYKQSQDNLFMINKTTLLKSKTLSGFQTFDTNQIIKERTIRFYQARTNWFRDHNKITPQFSQYGKDEYGFNWMGSGIVLDKELTAENPTYYLLTNKHVVNSGFYPYDGPKDKRLFQVPKWNWIDRIINKKRYMDSDPEGNDYYDYNFKGTLSFGGHEKVGDYRWSLKTNENIWELDRNANGTAGKFNDNIISIKPLVDFSYLSEVHSLVRGPANFNRYYDNFSPYRQVNQFGHILNSKSSLDAVILKVVFQKDKDPFAAFWNKRPTRLKSVDESYLARLNNYDWAEQQDHLQLNYGEQLRAEVITAGYPQKSDNTNYNFDLIIKKGLATFVKDDDTINWGNSKFDYEMLIDFPTNTNATGPGASGSPIFDHNLNFIAILYGGSGPKAKDTTFGESIDIESDKTRAMGSLFNLNVSRNLVQFGAQRRHLQDIELLELPYYDRQFAINPYNYFSSKNFSYLTSLQKSNPNIKTNFTESLKNQDF